MGYYPNAQLPRKARCSTHSPPERNACSPRQCDVDAEFEPAVLGGSRSSSGCVVAGKGEVSSLARDPVNEMR